MVTLASAASLVGCGGEVRKGERSLVAGDAERACAFFSTALDRDPDDARARRGMALALVDLAFERTDDGEVRPSDWGKAVRALERSDTATDSVVREALLDGRVRWARQLAKAGDTLRAEEILEGLVRARPERTGPRKSLAVLLAQSGRSDRAEDLLLENAAVDSTDVDTWFNLGLLAWNRGRPREAAEHFLKAERWAPTDPQVLWWAAKAAKEAAR